jgi:UDP-GlcNAc:undecaprenyl-phosphate/decaprenyl-phosphate GlcNAc-1-phosphate transferase
MDNLYVLMIIAGLLSLAFTPLIRKFAVCINAVSIPKDSRRVHKKPIPLIGGLAIYFSFMVTILLKKGNLSQTEIGMVLGASVITLGGFLDDKFELKPYQKLIFQIIGACLLIVFGVRILRITNPFYKINPYIDISWVSIPLTIIWVVGVTNALNLIDGLDGLAAGIAFISCITIMIIALLNGRMEAAFLTAILSGAILGFLPYNFNPARIFMGDTGAQLLGFLLAAISMEGAIKSAAAFAIVVPILAIGLPIYDTLFAMIRRKINGKPISQADRGHLHHRLLDMGLTQRQVVIIMYLISAILGGISVFAMQITTQQSYFLLTGVLIIIAFSAWRFGLFKHKE